MSIRVVGIGGSIDAGSQSQRALQAVLLACAGLGAATTAFTGAALDLPPYHPGIDVPAQAAEYIAAIRAADAVVIASPGYHGTVSGLVKNAVDYLDELRLDARPFLDGRAVGTVAVARGWQATVGTLATLREMVHALRGWPTPLGLAVNIAGTSFDDSGSVDDEGTAQSVQIMAGQLVGFAERFRRG